MTMMNLLTRRYFCRSKIIRLTKREDIVPKLIVNFAIKNIIPIMIPATLDPVFTKTETI